MFNFKFNKDDDMKTKLFKILVIVACVIIGTYIGTNTYYNG